MTPLPATTITVPTNDPRKTESEYLARGWKVATLFVGKFYAPLCDGHLWAISFWRPAQEELRLTAK